LVPKNRILRMRLTVIPMMEKKMRRMMVIDNYA
jgi:hypothetical protein